MFITGDSIVTVTDTNIYSNTAQYVCAWLWNLPGTLFRRPSGRNFPELTECKHVPCLAGWRDVHHWWHSDSSRHQHLLQQCQRRMRLPLEPSWYFLPTPPQEETSLNSPNVSTFLVWQGGGFFIMDGTVSFDSCNIHDNVASALVRACLWNFPNTFFLRPRRKKLP